MVEPETLLVEVSAAKLKLLLVDSVGDSIRLLSWGYLNEFSVFEILVPLFLDLWIVDLLAYVRKKGRLTQFIIFSILNFLLKREFVLKKGWESLNLLPPLFR